MLKSVEQTVGIAVVGLGGGVSTTVATGLEMLRAGRMGTDGLPLAECADWDDLVPYTDLRLAGWDLSPDDLAAAARGHRVVPRDELDQVAPALAEIRPWAAVADAAFCRNVTGEHVYRDNSKRALIARVQRDLTGFAATTGSGRVVVINLASTERCAPLDTPAFQTLEAFERALDANDPAIGPSMLYAYAALDLGLPFGNFTPNLAAEIPALIALARRRGAPIAGRDGKTGQTMMKTVLAPAFRARALTVEGWYSTNILGNRDGQALSDPASLASKLGTKGDVLDQMLGYPVGNHLVQISYYPPKGDDKEAWDHVDITGFLGQRMQIKVNFLCKDSILAAPLVIEIARCLDLAQRCGEGGPLEALGVFFKAPVTGDGWPPEHAFFVQQAHLMRWLATASAAGKADGARAELSRAAPVPAAE
ncbi:MAG: inositol-3-phosphate synthase [Paracoccaceae bacterium]